VDEPTLIRRAVAGDTAAWEDLMRAHQQAVFRLAYLIVGDPDDAEDVAQETFLRAWKHLKGFDLKRPLRPWLLSITSNLSSNRRRSAGRYFAALTRAFRDRPAPVTIEEKSSEQLQANELWKAVQKIKHAGSTNRLSTLFPRSANCRSLRGTAGGRRHNKIALKPRARKITGNHQA